MAAKKGNKKMTAREKAERAKVKKELQAKGILPPDKKPLNRKKFGRETWAEFVEECSGLDGLMELRHALGCMVSDNPSSVDAEQVGVYKLMKIAVELRRFKARLTEEGRTEYTIGELADVISPIIRL